VCRRSRGLVRVAWGEQGGFAGMTCLMRTAFDVGQGRAARNYCPDTARSAPVLIASRSFFSSAFCLVPEWNFSPNMSLT